jgi:outer membrane receptor protein involved in Fe transport
MNRAIFFQQHRFVHFRRLLNVTGVALFYLLASYLVFAENSPVPQTSKHEVVESIVTVGGSPVVEESEYETGSITILDGERLIAQGVNSPDNQLNNLPNVNWSAATARPRFFQIRGVGDFELYEGALNLAVAVMQDGVDLAGVSAAMMLFDIDSVQVFRGPQTQNFGPSGLAGVINLVTPDPIKKVGLDGLLTIGNADTVVGGLAIGDSFEKNGRNLGYRITLYRNEQNGFRFNDFSDSDSTNGRIETMGRAKLAVSDLADNKLVLSVQDVFLDNRYDAFSPENDFTTHSDRPGEDAERLKLISARVELPLSPSMKLLSLSSYYTYDLDYSFDGDWGNNEYWGEFIPYDFFSATNRKRDVFGQNIEWDYSISDRDRFKLGAYFQSFGEDADTKEYSDNIIYDTLQSSYNAETYAVYSSYDDEIYRDWVLTIGGRFDNRNMHYDDSKGAIFQPNDHLWGGEVGLRYFITPVDIIYTRLSRGFRGSGFNANPNVPLDRRSYEAENMVNLDIGFKQHLFDGRLIVDTNLFAYRRNDQVLGLSVQDDPDDPLSFTFITDNVATGRGFGAETQVDWFVTDRLLFNVNGSLLDTSFQPEDPLFGSLDRRQQSHSPSYQYGLNGSYRFTNAVGAVLGVTGRDSFYFSENHSQRSDRMNLFNATLIYTSGSYEISLWGRNLFNERYAVRGFFFGLEPPDFPEKTYIQLGDPRTFGMTFRVKL